MQKAIRPGISEDMFHLSNELYNFHHNKVSKGAPDIQRSNPYSNG